MKNCSKCRKNKDVSDFYSKQKWCKSCEKKRKQEYYRKPGVKEARVKYATNYLNSEMTEEQLIKRKEYHKEYCLRKRKEDINFRLAGNLRSRMALAVRYNWKSGSTVDDLGCSIEELKKYLESQFDEEMSWDNYGLDGWHIDHIKPLTSFDLTNEEQFKEACHYTNLQPLWAKDNLSKGSK